MAKRYFGEKIDFKSLSCAPVNEQGVVYLFGVLHDSFDFKIESIQTGFPDCIARRQVSKNKWEEIRIEFEYESKSFVDHGHDVNGADMIICWKHNWKDCPEDIEVIELSSIMEDLEDIHTTVKNDKKLSEYNKFCRDKRVEGLSFKEIASLWNEKKKSKPDKSDKSKKSSSENLTPYQKFTQEKILEGMTMQEAAKLWSQQKWEK